MIYDINRWIAEALFYLMNGELILNSIWILVWIVVGTVTLLIPFYLAIIAGRGRIGPVFMMVFLITFFPILIVIMGPPITQTQMLQECEPVTVTVSTDRIANESLDMRQCRYKTNYYDDFGAWYLAPQISG